MQSNVRLEIRRVLNNPEYKEKIAFSIFNVLKNGIRSEETDKIFCGSLLPREDPRNIDFVERSNSPYNTCMLFDYDPENYAYYVVGDLHGDIDSFIACVDAASKKTPLGKQTVLIILGDIIDRGGCSADCIAYLLLLALRKDKYHNNVKILFIKGDHDVALGIRENGCLELTQRTNHSEFFDSINELGKRCSPNAALAYAFVRFLNTYCPSSAYFSNGVFFAHGAVPHTDLQMRFGLDLTLWSLPCAQDFEWGRLTLKKEKSVPYRGTKTLDVGLNAFCSFFDGIKSLATYQKMKPVTLFIHGHEHPYRGYEEEKYDPYSVWTISSFREMKDDGTLAELPIASLLSLGGEEGTSISLIDPYLDSDTKNNSIPEPENTTTIIDSENQKEEKEEYDGEDLETNEQTTFI